MVIIQRNHRNNESQFMFPFNIVQGSVAFMSPPYLQDISGTKHDSINMKFILRRFVESTPNDVVREMRFYRNSIVVCYAHNREELLFNAKTTERLLSRLFKMDIDKE